MTDFNQSLAPFQKGLKKGTQISMSDSSMKNIENICYGDMILSIDIATREYILVKCYGVVRTSVTDEWKRYLFTDGNYLDINHDASVYSLTSGRPTDISSWQTGMRTFSQQLQRISLAWIQEYEDVEYSEGYILLSENSLYFANNILCGHQPHEKLKYHSLGITSTQLTEEDVENFKLSASIYQTNNDTRLADSKYIKEAVGVLAELSRVAREIESYAPELSSTKEKLVRQYIATHPEYATQLLEALGEQSTYRLQFKQIKARHPAGAKLGPTKVFRKAHAAENNRIKNKL